MKSRSLVWSLLAAVAFVAAVISFRPAVEAAPNPPPDRMKMHEQMMSEMKKADATLDALVNQMNGATGTAKVDAVAAVVAELVRQHKAMHSHMGEMHHQMMDGRGGMMRR